MIALRVAFYLFSLWTLIHGRGNSPIRISPRFLTAGETIKVEYSPDWYGTPATCIIYFPPQDTDLCRLIFDSLSSKVTYSVIPSRNSTSTISYTCNLVGIENVPNLQHYSDQVVLYEKFESLKFEGKKEIPNIVLDNGRISSVHFTLLSGSYLILTPISDQSIRGEEASVTEKKGYFTFQPSFFSHFGLQSITIDVQYYVKLDVACCKRQGEPFKVTVNYVEGVNQAFLNAPDSALVSTEITITANAKFGSKVAFEWESSTPKLWVFCFEIRGGSSSYFVLKLNTTGALDITVRIYNNVSSITLNKSVSVLRALEQFKVAVNSDNRELYLLTPAQQYFPVGNLSCHIIDPVLRHDTIQLYDLKPEQEILLLKNLPVGLRNISVNIESDVSTQKLVIGVDKYQPVTAKLYVKDPVQYVNVALEIVLQSSAGQGFQYYLEFGDGINALENLSGQDLDTDLRYYHTYYRTGRFNVTLEASNDKYHKDSYVMVTIVDLRIEAERIISFPPGNLTIDVYIKPEFNYCFVLIGQKVNIGVKLHSTVHYTFSMPGVYPVILGCTDLPESVHQKINVTVKGFDISNLSISYDPIVAKAETDVKVEFHISSYPPMLSRPSLEFYWSFPDNSDSNVVLEKNWTHVHLFQSRGLYNVSVTAVDNQGSDHTYVLPIQIGICDLTINSTSGQENIDIFKFSVSVFKSSKMNVTFFFGDTTEERFLNIEMNKTSSLSVSHMYRTAGRYRPSVLVSTTDWLDIVQAPYDINVMASGETDTTSFLSLSLDDLIRSPPGVANLTITVNDNYNELGQFKCSVNYSDREEIDQYIFSFNNSLAFTFQSKFKLVGECDVTAICISGLDQSIHTISASTRVESSCYLRSTPLFNLDNPSLKRVSEETWISAKPTIACTNMTSVFYWNIDQLINDSVRQYPFKQSNTTLLVLPAGHMEAGTYRITFYAYFKEMPSLFSTDDLIVKYERSPLFARIKGGSFKTVGSEQEVTIDGTTFSYDPDEVRGFNDHVAYTWSYSSHASLRSAAEATSKRTVNNCSDCEKLSSRKGVLVLIPGCLKANYWYVFYLGISRDRRQGFASQIIFVQLSHALQVSVDLKCKVNCMEKVNAEYSFSLETECLSCSEETSPVLDYNWQLFSEDQGLRIVKRFKDLTETGTNIANMAVKPYNLQPGLSYVLVSTCSLPGGPPTTLKRSFSVNFPPYNGSCFLTPKQGYAVYDRFRVICDGWVDEGDKLQRSAQDNGTHLYYRFILWTKSNDSLLYAGGSRMTTEQSLNPGDELLDFNVTITIRVYDTYQGMAEVNVTGQVFPPRFKMAKENVSIGEILNDYTKQIKQAKADGDIYEILRSLESAGSAVNTLRPKSKNQSSSYNESEEAWTDFWKDFSSEDITDDGDIVSTATEQYLEELSSSLKNASITSIDTVFMASSSLRTLVDQPERLETVGIESAVDVISVMGDCLSKVVTANMSDTQVTQVLQSVQGVIDKTLQSMIPSEATTDDMITFENSVEEIELGHIYTTSNETQTEGGELDISEKAFIKTRKKLIEQYRNKQKQELAKKHIPKLRRAIDNVLNSAATFMVEGQNAKTLRSSLISATVENQPLSVFLDHDIPRESVTLQIEANEGEATDRTKLAQAVSMKTVVFSQNPLTWDEKDTAVRITSPAVNVNISHIEGLGEPANLSRLFYTASLRNTDQTVSKQTILPRYIKLDRDQLLYHRMELKSTEDSIMLALKPSVNKIYYDVYVRCGQFPTTEVFHYRTSIKFNETSDRVIRIPGGKLPNSGSVYIGLKPTALEDDVSPVRKTRYNISVVEDQDTLLKRVKEASYELGITAAGCPVWEDSVAVWNTDHCQIADTTDHKSTTCSCDLSFTSIFTLATTFYLPVNTVDFSTVFTEIDLQNNSSVFAVVLILLVVYILLLIWARRKDKMDIIRWGVTGLADNDAEDSYIYIITVFTGLRPAAGTKSKVGFVIAGENSDTGVRALTDGVRKGFPNHSVLHFLMGVPDWLGDLQYLRIWHDNSGKGAMSSWFLHKVIVEDLQRDKKFVFMCDKWLGVDEDDGQIERILGVSSKNNLMSFSSLFYNNARENVTDSHIWFSVLFRPQRSHFTRVQRLSCCACLLFLSMICNALFYQGQEDIVRPTKISLGFLRLSITQVYTSLISIAIVTPVELGLIWFFKKSTPPDSYVDESFIDSCNSCFIPKKQHEMKKALLSKVFVKPRGTPLPHFCVYIAWTLVTLCVSTSAFFVFLLSQQWGRAKSEEWLTSFLLTFFESLVLLDPLKVVVLSVIVALFVHKIQIDPNDLDKEELKQQMATGGLTSTVQEHKKVNPLDSKEVSRFRVVRLREMKTLEVTKQIILYLLFLLLMCSIGYTNRDPRSFALKNNIHSILIKSKDDGRLGLNDVTTVEDYFHWLNGTAMPVLFHRTLSKESAFIDDLENVRVGPPRLRQVRKVQNPNPSNSHVSIETDGPRLGESSEETGDYCIGWKVQPCPEEERVFRLTSGAWIHTSSSQIWGMSVHGVFGSYSGGGYTIPLNVNLDVSRAVLRELFQNAWLDKSTTLLTLDLTLYNANTNLFCFVSFITEFPGTGGTITGYSIQPFRAYQYSGSLGYFVFWTEMCFLGLLLVAMIKYGLNLVKHGRQYICKFWSLVDLVTVISCLLAIGMYGLRKSTTETALLQYRKNSRQFINFQQVTFWDSIMVAMIGMVTFTCTVRTIKILGFSQRMSAIIEILSVARKDLIYFSLMVAVFLMAFVSSGYFMFSSSLKAYKTVLQTCETLLTSLVGKPPFKEMRDKEPVQAQIYFSSFIFFFVFILLTMFQVILNQSIARVRFYKDSISHKRRMIQKVLQEKLKQLMSLFWKHFGAEKAVQGSAPEKNINKIDNTNHTKAEQK